MLLWAGQQAVLLVLRLTVTATAWCDLHCRLSNDFLLPTLITFLNDRDWQTRAAFFRGVACMAAHAGTAGMEAFLLPCVEQVLEP